MTNKMTPTKRGEQRHNPYAAAASGGKRRHVGGTNNGGGVPKELVIGTLVAIVLLMAVFFGLKSCSEGSSELFSDDNARLTVYSVEGSEIGRYDGAVTLTEEDGEIKLTFDGKTIASVSDQPDGNPATNDGGSATEEPGHRTLFHDPCL